MNSLAEIKKYIIKYKPKGLIIDTNILILFLIGSYDDNYICSCELTKKYTQKDFELLKKIISFFNAVLITPYVIAELSNLSRKKITECKRIAYFKTVIKFLETTSEENPSLTSLLGCKIKLIEEFGFTDMAIFNLSKNKNIPILTDDGPFFHYSYSKTPTIKFEHIKFYPINEELFQRKGF